MVNYYNKFGTLQGATDVARFDISVAIGASGLVQCGISHGNNREASWHPVYVLTVDAP
ncbi:hypothetical protein [Tateyamaria sp.]|uniref:hypothetical protein n=1 Tax=Tateyamaria sp. TaxID=1929288 RepID=UPI00329D9D3D